VTVGCEVKGDVVINRAGDVPQDAILRASRPVSGHSQEQLQQLRAGHRYVQLAPVYESGGRYHIAFAEDRELADLVDAAQHQLTLIAKVRGVPFPLPPPIRRGLTQHGNPMRPGKTNPEA
jgi:hypothetical protein